MSSAKGSCRPSPKQLLFVTDNHGKPQLTTVQKMTDPGVPGQQKHLQYNTEEDGEEIL